MSNEVRDLIKQIKNLHIQQNVLLDRLEKAQAKEGATKSDEPRQFEIGDYVTITNPNLFQANKGTVTKIGPSRVTVTTNNGTKILRAPKNLVFNDERE